MLANLQFFSWDDFFLLFKIVFQLIGFCTVESFQFIYRFCDDASTKPYILKAIPEFSWFYPHNAQLWLRFQFVFLKPIRFSYKSAGYFRISFQYLALFIWAYRSAALDILPNYQAPFYMIDIRLQVSSLSFLNFIRLSYFPFVACL
jgi:hypothetical protein